MRLESSLVTTAPVVLQAPHYPSKQLQLLYTIEQTDFLLDSMLHHMHPRAEDSTFKDGCTVGRNRTLAHRKKAVL